MATQDDYIRTALRVPPELHAKIHESAKGNNRTFNAEIVARLERSFASSLGVTQSIDQGMQPVTQEVHSSILGTGIRFAELAAHLLKAELPEVAKRESYKMLLQAIYAALDGISSQRADSPAASLSSAKAALDAFKELEDRFSNVEHFDEESSQAAAIAKEMASAIGAVTPPEKTKPRKKTLIEHKPIFLKK